MRIRSLKIALQMWFFMCLMKCIFADTFFFLLTPSFLSIKKRQQYVTVNLYVSCGYLSAFTLGSPTRRGGIGVELFKKVTNVISSIRAKATRGKANRAKTTTRT